MRNYTRTIFFLLAVALSSLPYLSNAQCMGGETLNTYCYGQGESNTVGIEVCPTAGMAIESEIVQGNFAFGGNNLTVYSGAAGSATGGTIVFGPATGPVTGNTIASLGADQCLIFVFNTIPGVPLTCADGFDPELQVCSASIPAAAVSLMVVPDVFCSDDGSQTLGGGLPGGGVYSSATPGAVTDDGNGSTFTFDPSAATGTITVTYTNGASATDDIMVVAAGATVFDVTQTAFCVDDSPLVLPGNVMPAGGSFSGPGVTDSGNGSTFTFNPGLAGIGMHTITYTGPAPCNDLVTDMIEVTAACTCPAPQTSYFYCQGNNETGTVAFEVCPSAGMAAQATINSGGFSSVVPDMDRLDVYSGASGSGTSGTLLSGNLSGNVGGMVISGSVADECLIFVVNTGPVGSCQDGTEASLSVCGEDIAPAVTFLDTGDFCETDLPAAGLTGGIPTGGVYSSPTAGAVTDAGNGQNFTFTAVNGPGTYELVYTLGGGMDNIFVEVFASGSVSFTALNDLCIDAGIQQDLSGGMPAGGSYSGPGVTDNGDGTYDFNPAIAGLGQHTITYTSAAGCIETATDQVEVLAACGCPGGEQSFFHCTDNNENNLIVFELCPTDPGMAIQATINQGSYSNTVPDGDQLTVYSGLQGSGSGGTVVFGPAGGNLAGIEIKSLDANHCLTFVSNTGPVGSCIDGAELALQGCAIDVPPPTMFTPPADLCVSAGIQMNLVGGSPSGGTYSGDIAGAVMDNGDGTYNLDPSVGPGTLTITYTANGEAASGTVELLEDLSGPVVVGTLSDDNIEGCGPGDFPVPASTIAELELMGLDISDDCSADADLSLSSSISTTGSCPIQGTITYTITDEGGQTATVTQNFTVDDTTLPVVSGTLTTLNIEGCSAADAPPAYSTVAELESNGVMISDNCTADGDLNVQVSGEMSGTCPIVMTRTYTVTDVCSNESVDIVQTINIDDTTAPMAECVGSFTLELNPNGEGTLLTADIDNGSSDNCGNINLSLSQEAFTCADLGVNTITLTATDDCGNSDNCSSTVTVEIGDDLPGGWTTTDIGQVTVGNAYSFDPCSVPVPSEGGFSITGSGNNAISSTTDNVAYASQTLCGDGMITVKVESVTSNGYGGLMIRESLSAGSRQVSLFSNLTNSLRHEVRYTTNGPKQVQNFFKPAPIWLRMQRQGSWVFMYYSSTGAPNSFQYVHGVFMSLPSCIEIGLASFTFQPNQQTTAIFSNVTIEGGAAPLNSPVTQALQAQDRLPLMDLFPNPAREYLTLQFGQPYEVALEVVVLNAFGQLVETRQLQPGVSHIGWDVSQLPAGTYWLKVDGEGLEPQVKSFVVTK
jgi:hypothetical protein